MKRSTIMMNDGGMGFGFGGMGLTWVFGLLMAAGVVLLVIVLVRAVSGRSRTPGEAGGSRAHGTGSGPAREILEERYARGEISTDEYRERLRGLENSR